MGVAVTQCGNYGNLLSHSFDKNFVKVTFLLKESSSIPIGTFVYMYQMGMEMGREWRCTKMEIENRISSLYQSMVSDRDGNGDAKWGWG